MKQHESEHGLIGSCMLSSKAVELCTEMNVLPEWFTDSKSRVIYKAIREIHNAGGKVDSFSVAGRLRAEREIENVGGIAWLRKLESDAVSSAFSEYHVSLLMDAYGRRELERAMHEVRTQLADPAMSAEMIAADASAKLDRLFAGSGKDNMTFDESAEAGYSEWSEVAKGNAIAVPTGIGWFDDNTGGVPDRALVIISGGFGSCKTTLARQICEYVAKTRGKVSMRSLEQSSTQIAQATIAAEAGVTVSSMNMVPRTDEERADRAVKIGKVRAAKERLSGLPFEINDKVATVSEFRAWAIRKANRGSKLLCVDYLQRLLPEKGSKPSQEEHVSACSTVVYEVAKRTGVPIIAVASENRKDQVRGSGQAEYDAMIILRITKATEENGYGAYDWKNNPCYVVRWIKARFAPAGHEIPVYWHYGRLISKKEFEMERMNHGWNH